MASVPPPHGLNEADYEVIEAAVTETVRGRWFLSEFARRNRLAETRQLLDAMARLEAVVTAGQTALPSADPSIRLLIQRIKEVAGQLTTVAGDMRAAGVEAQFSEAVELQARAVAGMMRVGAAAAPAAPAAARLDPPSVRSPSTPSPSMPRMPRAELPPAFATPPRETGRPDADPRLAVLSGLDGLTLAEKLALFR